MITIKKWMIYGAYGYTGELIAREAVRRGHQPILAGRDEARLLPLAEELDLPYQVFGLEEPYKIKRELEPIGLVLNCAGPFNFTATGLRDVCVDNGVHYLDITGEMEVLADSLACHDKAVETGSVVISGVGFDVVPTDTLAAILKERLPTATQLELAFAGDGGVSPGTAITMVEMIHERGAVRENGEIKPVPLAYEGKTIAFSDRSAYCMSIPWGDIETAWHSTHIPNIKVFTATPEDQVKWVRRMNGMVGVFRFKPLRRFIQSVIAKKLKGPDQQTREKGCMRLWGKVSDGEQSVEAHMDTPEGYDYTVMSSLFFVELLLAHKIMPGAYTPATAVPWQTLIEMENVTCHIVGEDRPINEIKVIEDIETPTWDA